MDELSIGIVVEGVYDEAVMRVLVPRVVRGPLALHIRACGGKSRLFQKYLGYFREFEHVQGGEPVRKALVVCDADGKPSEEVKRRLSERAGSRSYRFPEGYHFCVVRQQIETWLLASGEAIHAVVRERGGAGVRACAGPFEEIPDAKRRFLDLLARAGLAPTHAVYEAIAERADLQLLRQACPSFAEFEESVRDC